MKEVDDTANAIRERRHSFDSTRDVPKHKSVQVSTHEVTPVPTVTPEVPTANGNVSHPVLPSEQPIAEKSFKFKTSHKGELTLTPPKDNSKPQAFTYNP
jgi:hypothetical protein